MYVASGVGVCEHLTKQLRLRVSIVYEVYVARSSLSKLVLRAKFLSSTPGVRPGCRHSVVMTTVVGNPAGIVFNDYRIKTRSESTCGSE